MIDHAGRRRFLASLTCGSFLGIALYELIERVQQPRRRLDPPDTSLLDVMIRGRLRVGIDPSYPPFEFITAENTFAGFDIDLAASLSEHIGVTSETVLIGLDGLYDALRVRKIDAAISSIVPGPKAGKDVVFSQPYFNAGLVYCVAATDPTRNPQNRPGATIAVELGSEGEEFLKRRGTPGQRIMRVEDVKDALESLAAGKVQGVLTDVPTAALLRHQISGFVVLDPPVTQKPYAIALRATDHALLLIVNQQLQTLKQQGELRHITDTWL